MKALSILQPWASLIVMGAKKIETRSFPTKFRGPLLIHAGRNKEMAIKLCQVPVKRPFRDFIWHYSELPYGAVLGTVDVIGIIPTEQVRKDECIYRDRYDWYISEKELAFGDYSPGRFGWLLANPVRFHKPIYYPGKLGLWDFPNELLPGSGKI